MADWRTMFDSDWIRAWDLGGKAVTLTIVKVEAQLLEDPKRRKKDKRPVVWFKQAKKPLALNKTNAKTVAAMYSNETAQWINKNITLYPARTQFGQEEVDCIRIKPQAPKGPADEMPKVEPPPREPGSDDDKGAP